MSSVPRTTENEDSETTHDATVTSVATEEFVAEQYLDDDELELEEEEERRWFRLPTKEQWRAALPFLVVYLLAAILRFWQLGERPLHHDESLHGYFALQLLHNNIEHWSSCLIPANKGACYSYDPLLHGPFQFHAIAIVYLISQLLGVADHGVNTTTVRIVAAVMGTGMVMLPYVLRSYIGRLGAWIASFLMAVSPSLVYYSRFAREDIYMAFFTLWMVVAFARYIQTRKASWFIAAAAAFTLSYATNEATFLTIAVFGSFFVAVIAWEIGGQWTLRFKRETVLASRLPRTGAPLVLVAYFIVLALFAKWFFGYMDSLSRYITGSQQHQDIANAFVNQLKLNTERLMPWLGIVLALIVIVILLREQFGKVPLIGRRGIARKINPQRQRLLDTIFTMPWTHWFFAIVLSWFIFLVLFTALFTDLPNGIGNGIWEGLYYWLQQQQVARGGQPWYYYLLLIPLYEQIGLVFGIVGIIRCLVRPTRLRLFLVYWFVGNVVIYSWAGEKMPWLTIHMTMPMMILAAIGLEPAALKVYHFVRERWLERRVTAIVATDQEEGSKGTWGAKRRAKWALGGSFATLGVALLLLLPTLQNMYQLNFIHEADAPHEMMIYVQTTPDINIVMNKVGQIDQKMDGGNHQLMVGITNDATWPYAWYMRDYTDVCYNFTDGCGSTADPPVIITAADDVATIEARYGADYDIHQYVLRSQWDQGYMPPPCIPTPGKTCPVQQYVGVGPWLWLSYGDNPPPGAKFNLARAATNIWDWWWYRKAFGATNGGYNMYLLIRKDVVQQTGVQP
jgi:uncharacterized protein (TIGR03663 family)